MNIHQSLANVQKSLVAPKGQFNKFGGYNYRNCEDILEGLKHVLGEASVLLSDEIVAIEGRFYVKATASYCLGDEKISVSAYAREATSKKGMDDSQLTGSSSSYARKYALNGLFAIDDTKDADTRDNSKNKESSTLIDLMIDGSEFDIANYWRSLSQDFQQAEWIKLDRDSQKKLKEIMASIPAETKQ